MGAGSEIRGDVIFLCLFFCINSETVGPEVLAEKWGQKDVDP